ncbi:MAG: sigma-E processing peptidase SpoIIGA [Clostridia bacterium]|nr:sigma-E processing peptidase SpoIIGA [Clostridia bacterium]
MQVYIELAVLENFCMDFTLLYAAKAAVKNPSPFWRIIIAAILGAAFAVVFPLFKLGAVWSAVVKVLSGFLICLVAGKFKGIKSYLKFSFAFLIFTAFLGGALIGAFALTGLDFAAGEGFILSKIPIGIPMLGALLIIIGAKKLAARLKKSRKDTVTVRLFLGGESVEVKGFFDSGNKVYCRGAPVSIIPEEIAEKIVDGSRIKDGVKIHTVAGSKIIKIFTADKIEIDFGEKKNNLNGVKIGISPQRINTAVLHPDLLEDIYV